MCNLGAAAAVVAAGAMALFVASGMVRAYLAERAARSASALAWGAAAGFVLGALLELIQC